MAIPFSPSSKPASFTAASLINKTSRVFESRPDSRKKTTANHLKYAITDAALSAFAVFFTQSPSFLDYQTRMQQAHGKNNAQSIFGVPPIPSANPIRNLLDSVPLETVFPLLQEIGDGRHQHGYLEPFRSVSGTLLVALDGTDFFSSKKISCLCEPCAWKAVNWLSRMQIRSQRGKPLSSDFTKKKVEKGLAELAEEIHDKLR